MSFRHGILALCATLTLAAPIPAAADPVLMILISVAREVIASAARRQQSAPVVPAPVTNERYPGTTVEPAHLRKLIDECFGYLTSAQRGEIFESLHTALSDTKNAAIRGSLIEFFAARALAVRDAQERLSKLSTADQERLLAEFKVAVAAMPAEEAAQVGELLRQRVLPVPGELNAQLLAAIDARN